jgi:dihydropteroate synthase
MPGAEAISTKKEGQRIIPVLKQIRSERPDKMGSMNLNCKQNEKMGR